MRRNIILGAGMTGLAAGITSGWPIYEAEDFPGGICSSYYMRAFEDNRILNTRYDDNVYRFEIGGGHWIFGTDKEILKFIKSYTKVKKYVRKSSIFFYDMNIYVPYPIQSHLSFLPKYLISSIIDEINQKKEINDRTMYDWLLYHFGKTLCDIFFFPFHDLYTAGLYKHIIPQDQFKSPINKRMILKGAQGKSSFVGYNTEFIYPTHGLNEFNHKMAEKLLIYFGKKANYIDIQKKLVIFNDNSTVNYNYILSTIPLNDMIRLCHIDLNMPEDPCTSVLVLNIGARKGRNCPDDHWLYIPKSNSRFHRVGFYTNVDISFLPKRARIKKDLVGIYVEKSFKKGNQPSKAEVDMYKSEVIKELGDWGFIGEIEVIDATWIECAYTWAWPESEWRFEALNILSKFNIHQIGRYGRWKFQGIADSLKDGRLALNKIYKGYR